MNNIKLSILFIISVLFLFSCKDKSEQAIETPASEDEYYLTLSKEQLNSEDLKLDSVQNYNFQEFFEASGTVEIPPNAQNIVTTLYPGRISGLNYNMGQLVKKGQLLFSIENPELIDLQQRLSSLSEELKYLKDDYQRQEKLYNENANSEKKFIKAESDYKSNLAEYNGLKKKLEILGINLNNVNQGNFTSKYSIYSPISGAISDIYKTNGEYCEPSENILKIVNKGEAHLSLTIYENDIDKIKRGQTVTFKTSDGKEHNAKIHLISPTIDPRTRSLLAHADIENLDSYYDNMYVTAKIISDEKTHKALPKNALLKDGDENFILVLDKHEENNYFFTKYPIKLSHKNDKYFSFDNIEDLQGKSVITEGAIILQKDE